jgi:Zn-dependent protease with chaperone function
MFSFGICNVTKERLPCAFWSSWSGPSGERPSKLKSARTSFQFGQLTHQSYPQLYNLVEALAIGDGLPAPASYVVGDASPNAFVTSPETTS